ncbi:MAG: hydratase [Oscillospiraceae bacterium]|nr:hydratase [Oscillospiraceae bacterium]
MIKSAAYYSNNGFTQSGERPETARYRTIAYKILKAHSSGEDFHVKFDALASHDITYVGIVQTARASGLTRFPVQYVLTNCHNSLCAVGGTINADDHAFGLSAAKRYGGEFVPAHMAVIHQYMRERYAASGKMILASDSHTRYGAFGTLSVGEGGPEIVKQLLGRTYDLTPPPIWAVHITGERQPGVGAQDIALKLIGEVFPNGLVKNCVLEFIGSGIKNLDMDTRNGIDVMTTETTCLSSVWQTDETVREWLAIHGRENDYKELSPEDGAYYDGVIELDLSKIEPMIALPFHPSNVYTIKEFNRNAGDILSKISPELVNIVDNGRIIVQQGIIGGCAGGLFGSIHNAAEILKNGNVGNGIFELSVYPSSQPMALALTRDGTIGSLMENGVTVRTAFCGPCFGAGDVPVNKGFSIRHVTRNFPNREGSKPANGQEAYVALMDARSIAATARNGGRLTAATELPDIREVKPEYKYDPAPYTTRVFFGAGKPDASEELRFGPGIADWPEQIPLPDDIELTIAAVLLDEVTTTDELIPSGETSSYRSNPHHLAEFTLSRREPEYVGRAKTIRETEFKRREIGGNIGLGSVIVARKPGDGSAREQAASCQRVLGGLANIAAEYATRRYRSNLINWGIIPFICNDFDNIQWKSGDKIKIAGIRKLIADGGTEITATLNGEPIALKTPDLSQTERETLLAGCLINYYKNEK